MKAFALVCAVSAATAVSGAPYRQSVGVSALDLFNVGIKAGFVAQPDPAAAAKTNHEYLDGYNRLDSSGNLGEGAPGLPSRTSNFGFISNQQVDLARGTLSWHTVTPGDSSYVNRGSSHGSVGAELNYRIVRDVPGRAVFGLEARAGHIDVDYSSSDDLTTSVRVLTDAYQLGGVVPQPAPYSGSFNVQPGTQRIGDTPTRSIATATATTSGHRDLATKGWLVRLGVVWVPLQTGRIAVELHGGPAALNLESSVRLEERVVATGQPAVVQSASASTTKWVTGAYAGAALRVRLADHWEAVGGLDYLTADTVKVNAATAVARFDFSRAVVASAGVSFRF